MSDFVRAKNINQWSQALEACERGDIVAALYPVGDVTPILEAANAEFRAGKAQPTIHTEILGAKLHEAIGLARPVLHKYNLWDFTPRFLNSSASGMHIDYALDAQNLWLGLRCATDWTFARVESEEAPNNHRYVEGIPSPQVLPARITSKLEATPPFAPTAGDLVHTAEGFLNGMRNRGALHAKRLRVPPGVLLAFSGHPAAQGPARAVSAHQVIAVGTTGAERAKRLSVSF